MIFYIEFDTKDMPGHIKATRVQLDQEVVRDRSKVMNIALCNSPLYPALERYVLANPTKKDGVGK